MRGKMWFLSGVAVGFVVGARAGRERYDQLVRAARELWDHPTVQEAAGVVQAQANRLYAEGKDVVSDKISSSKLGERLGRRSETDGELIEPAESANAANAVNRPPGSTF
jgi:hypothetical protein